MTRPPGAPDEQKSFAHKAGDSDGHTDRRDLASGVQSPDAGDADVNLDTQGRFGNLRQNMTTQWKTQQR